MSEGPSRIEPGSKQVGRFDRASKSVITVLGIFLCLFTLFEVNYNLLQPQSALAVFVGVGLALCFLDVSAFSSGLLRSSRCVGWMPCWRSRQQVVVCT